MRGQVPIIALTANAVSGMREMFLSRGFSGFLAKPIDVSKLDEIMGKWIPKHKQYKAEIIRRAGSQTPADLMMIPGLDTQQGIAMTGGAGNPCGNFR